MELAPFLDALIGSIPELKKINKTFGVVPGSRAHIMEASDCVYELFGWRTVTRPVAKNRLPYFVPKIPGYTLFCQLAIYVCSSHIIAAAAAEYESTGKVVNPARGQLNNRENEYFPVPVRV